MSAGDAERGEQAAADLRKEGDAHALDVTNDASVKAAAATYGKTSDTLDVLVNNAGVATGSYVVPARRAWTTCAPCTRCVGRHAW